MIKETAKLTLTETAKFTLRFTLTLTYGMLVLSLILAGLVVIVKVTLAGLVLFLPLAGISNASEIAPWMIVPSFGILIVSLGNQRNNVSVGKLLIFHVCILVGSGLVLFICLFLAGDPGAWAAAMFAALITTYASSSAGNSACAGVSGGSVAGALTALSIGLFIALAGGAAPDSTANYQMVLDYLVSIAIVCLVSLIISRIVLRSR